MGLLSRDYGPSVLLLNGIESIPPASCELSAQSGKDAACDLHRAPDLYRISGDRPTRNKFSYLCVVLEFLSGCLCKGVFGGV